MKRILSLSLVASLSLATLAACVEDAPPPVAELTPPTAEERPELGKSYDVATGLVEEDDSASLEAIRRHSPSERLTPLPGTPGPRFADAEGAQPSNVVFGDDGRVRVTPTTSFPASARVRLVLEFSDGYTSAGSGAMIGAKYVLTAGHVVFSHDHGGWATKITAFPGQDASYKPFGPALATKLRSNTGWTEDENSDYDYGLITLNQNIGNQVGVYGLGSFSDDTLDDTTAYVYGYPGDKAWGTQWGNGGPIETYNSKAVFYDMDTAGGMSGAGVYRWFDGARFVFAIHTGDGWWWLEHYNRATRITNARFDLILDWMATGT